MSTEQIISNNFVDSVDAGFLYFDPIMKRVVRRVQDVLNDLCETNGFDEVQMPAMHNKVLVETSGKFEDYEREFYVANNQVMISTSEEYFLTLAAKGLTSYAQLPVRYFTVTEAFRRIKRPEGFLKTRQFGGTVLHSFDVDQVEQKTSLGMFEGIIDSFFQKLRINAKKVRSSERLDYYYPHRKGEQFEVDGQLSRGVNIAMGYRFDRVHKFGTTFRSNTNEAVEVTMGTYGVGMQRTIFAMLDSCRDSLGFDIPAIVRPFDVAVIPVNADEVPQWTLSNRVYSGLKTKSHLVYLDDRKLSFKARLDFADFIGVGKKLVIGKNEVASGKFSYRDRQGAMYEFVS